MHSRQAGFQLIEALVVLALISLVALIAAPNLIDLSARARVSLTAHDVARVMHSARSYAIRYSANVAVKFRLQDDGAITFTLYLDGDGDGVRNSDIESGRDPQVAPPRRLRDAGNPVRFGFPPEVEPSHPSDPHRKLDHLEDPIRFNGSDLASFTAIGGATPGTVYLTDGRRELMAVRVQGLTGKITIVRYDRQTDTWK